MVVLAYTYVQGVKEGITRSMKKSSIDVPMKQIPFQLEAALISTQKTILHDKTRKSGELDEITPTPRRANKKKTLYS